MTKQPHASDDEARRGTEAYLAGLRALDPLMIASAFDEAGEFENPVGSPVRRGRDEIATFFAEGLCSLAQHVEIDVVFSHVSSGYSTAYWHMRAVSASGVIAKVEGIDVLKVSDEGLILRAKGYWDQSALLRTLSG